MKTRTAVRHFASWAILISLLCLLGCSRASNEPTFLGDYRVTENQVTFLDNVAYSHLKEDPKIVHLVQTCRPQLKQLMTGPLQQSLSKRPGRFIYVRKWPTQLRLYQHNGKIFHVGDGSSTIAWSIENRAIELLSEGSVRIIDTGSQEPK